MRSRSMIPRLIAYLGCILLVACPPVVAAEKTRVVVDSEDWKLVGDLRLPDFPGRLPAVLLLNKAAGDRRVYAELAAQLAQRGMASLRLDLRGHGESTNAGRFVPGETDSVARENMIWGADVDVVAAQRWLREHPRVDGDRIGIVGASYSGEEMAEAGRRSGFARAYVALSPGSFREESIATMDSGGASWLFIASRQERYLQEITAAVVNRTRDVEMVLLPGREHATRILEARPDVTERIAAWLAWRLQP